jgi:2-C-methyl-D-erythritol 4-phosphate cytidylyltransferase
MSYKNRFVSVIVPAAGMGKRMNSEKNKVFIFLNNKPVLAHTLEKFEDCEYVDEIILVVKKNEVDYCLEEIVMKYGFKKVKKVVKGGKERQDSVYNGLLAIDKKCDVVLVHDGARPFIEKKSIVNGIRGAIEHGACVVGVPVKDTIKVVNSDNYIIDTPKRSTLWAVQTPQCFSYDIIMEAYENARKNSIIATDDSMLVENIGYKVKMIMGSYTNIKLTTPEDMKFGEVILREE